MILLATQCFPPKLGGIETYMVGLADAAAAEGRAVNVFADGEASAWDQGRPYAVRRFAGFKPLRGWRKARALRKALVSGQVERIFFDSWKSLETSLPALKGLRRHPRLICLAHGMEFPAAASAAKARRIENALREADAVLANSPYTAQRARAYLHDDASLRVETPPIQPQPEATESARAAVRSRLGLAPDAPLIAALARHEPRKSFDHLIRAAALLAPEIAGLTLAIGGDGPDRPRLEALAEETGAPVRFLGRISEGEKAALLAEAALFAMPSREDGDSVEGFGLVYLEAAWYGTPALAGRAGGASAAVRDGETGWICDGASAAAVREAIAAILSDRVELHRRGYLAAAHAKDQLWSARIGRYLDA